MGISPDGMPLGSSQASYSEPLLDNGGGIETSRVSNAGPIYVNGDDQQSFDYGPSFVPSQQD